MSVPKWNIDVVRQLTGQGERFGIQYGFGSKAGLSIPINKIERIDCSGWFRWLAFQATAGQLKAPDGSQNQREWCERMKLHELREYSDVTHAAMHRLFVSFIRPYRNGAGAVGHVWLTLRYKEGQPVYTSESCGGRGVTARHWANGILVREHYCTFELPAFSNLKAV